MTFLSWSFPPFTEDCVLATGWLYPRMGSFFEGSLELVWGSVQGHKHVDGLGKTGGGGTAQQ
ncbi:hypothetical protein C8R43DRAFT_1119251 [Mycena crocata]|nr:hypothetical protein C8R43DRAFT_1119251 [Mycena crocata]